MSHIHLQGACLCGTIQYEVTGEPKLFFFCHCSQCRKETGTAHGANLFVKNGQVQFTAGAENYTHYALEGSRKARNFCKTCGSPVPRMAGTTAIVPAGGVEGDIGIEPTAHIFCDSAAAWDDAIARTPRFPEYMKR